MSIPLPHVVAAVVLTFAMILPATAADPPHRCASVADPGERLVCYDAAFPPADGARPAVDIKAERERALRDFGLNQNQLRERDPERMREVSPGQIEATVTAVSTRATGERVLSLDSGQTWLLTEVTSRGYLKVGDRVVIREAALGSFMVLTPKRVALRARRVQ